MTAREARGRAPPGVAVSHERLSQYRRYAELVSAQESALDHGDLEQVRKLADELSALEGRIGSPIPGERAIAEGGEDAEHAAELLRDALDRTREMASRLRAMKEAEGAEVRRTLTRRPQARAYVTRDAEIEPARSSRLDVKS